MANIKSQKKRIITNEKSRLRNMDVKSRVRTYVKKAEQALAGKDLEQIKAAVQTAVREIDRATSKGVLHANSAARKKSTLHRKALAAGK